MVILAAFGKSSPRLNIDFDNSVDETATVISIEGETKSNLLLSVAGAFSTMNIQVLDAMVKTTEDGTVMDVFRVTKEGGGQIDAKDFDDVRGQINTACQFSEKSSQPAIYGVAAAAEVQRLRPLAGSATEAAANQLELAAAEMAQAAASLVTLERDISNAVAELVTLRGDAGEDPVKLADIKAREGGVQELESRRSEAAAVLERRMAAMEAALAARRSPDMTAIAPAEAAHGGGAEGRFFAGQGGTGTGPAAGNGYEIILQGFNWESCKEPWYKILKSQASGFKESGFTAIWLPPATDAVSPQGYLPRDLYDLNSKYGDEGELRDLLRTFKELNIKSVADIVINHRCAHSQDDRGRWNTFGGRLNWGPDAICCDNPEYGGRGQPNSGEDYTAAPNIDHSQAFVREDLKTWMKWMRSKGFDGWRFDFVKGYSGNYTREYIDASVPSMAFGEFWDACDYTDGVLDYNQDRHRQRTVNWCDETGGTAAAFDFTTKGILQEAVARNEFWRLTDAQGRPPGLIGLWPSRAVTFIENHDTGSTLNHWPFPTNAIGMGYAYILTHPGTPCVFYDHYFQKEDDVGENVMALMKLRKDLKLSARSTVAIQVAMDSVYAALIDDKLAMKIGYGDWSPNAANVLEKGGQWKRKVEGPGYAVWTLKP